MHTNKAEEKVRFKKSSKFRLLICGFDMLNVDLRCRENLWRSGVGTDVLVNLQAAFWVSERILMVDLIGDFVVRLFVAGDIIITLSLPLSFKF